MGVLVFQNICAGRSKLFHHKNLSWSVYKQPMGAGNVPVPITSPDEWFYPSPNDTEEIILKVVCRYVN